MKIFFIILLIASCAGIIAATMSMEPKSGSASDILAAGGGNYSQTTRVTKEKMLNKVTIICSVIFVIALLGVLKTA